MTEENREKIKLLLTKLEKAHGFYIKTDEKNKERLFNQCEFLFKQLAELRVDRIITETLLVYGKEFIEAEYKTLLEEDQVYFEMACNIFGVDPKTGKPVISSDNPASQASSVPAKPEQQTFA